MSKRIVAAVTLGVVIGALGCNKPVPRPAGTDGTSRWAYGIAQPSFGGDYELRQILGGMVFLDGRLPANTGSWSFVAWSPSQQKTRQVTIAANASVSVSDRNAAPPGPGIAGTLPSTWADSPQILGATDGRRDSNATIAKLMALNVTRFNGTQSQAAWGINFDAGNNQLVSVDGTYLGPQ